MHSRAHWLLIAVLLALVAASCSNSEDDTNGASSEDPTAATGDVSDTATEDPPAETGGDNGETTDDTGEVADDRDTFVEITGVPGVSDDEISYAVIATEANNPLGTCMLECYVQGIQAYFDFRNGEGGLYGRDLVIGEVLDDELSSNQVRSIDVISAEDAFGVFSSTLLASGWGDLDEAGVPTYGWNIHPTEFANRPSIIGHIAATCATCIQRGVPYLVGLSGESEVAVLGYGISENSKVCAQTLKESIETHADDIGGAEVAYFNDELGFGLPNGIGPEVTAMKEAGVGFVASCMDLNGMKTLGQELQRQGMDEVVMAHPNTYDQGFVAEAGGVFEGDYITPQFLPFEAETGNKLQATFEEFMAADGSEPTEMAMVGFINADQAFTALLEAGPDFDRQKAIDGINGLTEETSSGLHVPIDWTRQHVPPTPDDPMSGSPEECFAPVQVIDGQFETVADSATPWFCWSNENKDWSDPEQIDFGDAG